MSKISATTSMQEEAPTLTPAGDGAEAIATSETSSTSETEAPGTATSEPKINDGAIADPIPATLAINGRVTNLALGNLRSHPLSSAIYGIGCDEELATSVRTNGILQPLLVAPKTNEILAGNSRAEAARRCGMTEVPVIYFCSEDALDIETAVLDTNKQRIKTAEQITREYNAWKRIEGERAKLRMSTNTGQQGMKTFADAEKGTARDKAAERLGMSGVTLEKGAAVVAVIDQLEMAGKTEDATQIRTTLNSKSFESAHKEAKARGLIKGKRKKRKAKSAGRETNARGKFHSDGVDRSLPNIDDAHGKALEQGDNVLTFLKASGAKVSATQRADWEKLLHQVVSFVKTLNWAIA